MKLRNFLIDWLKKKGLGWKLYQADTLGKEFVVLLADVLWYVEGRHDRFNKQAKPIPAAFTEFPRFHLPEQSKHRKAENTNLSAAELQGYSNQLFQKLEQPWLKREAWREVSTAVHQFACSLRDYASLLVKKRQETVANHAKLFPVRSDSDSRGFVVYQAVTHIPPKFALRYLSLFQALNTSPPYQPVFLNDFLPSDSRERYTYLEDLRIAIQCPAVRFTHSSGNNKGNTHFIWKICVDDSEVELLNKNTSITAEIERSLPVYHTRAMRREAIHSFGRLCSAKPAVLREVYRRLAGDSSASTNVDQAQVDEHVRLALDCEDEEIIWDLRELNERHQQKYSVFWDYCQQYIDSRLEAATDERRHDSCMHFAVAMSVKDFTSEVSKLCPEGTPIPSEKWVYLQFWPKDSTKLSSLHHTGRFRLKFLVQVCLIYIVSLPLSLFPSSSTCTCCS